MELRYLSRADVESLCISMADIIAVVEEGFRRKGMGETQMPPKIAIHSRPGEAFLHAMPAYVGGLDIAAIKWVGGNEENLKRGLPNITGLIVINDAETMVPLAIMDGSWITAMRTGAANAVAMKYLGPASADTVAVVGCGVQGRSNLLAMLTHYTGIARVQCYDVVPQALEAFVGEAETRYDGVEFVAAAGPRAAVEGADVVVTAGPSPKHPSPYLRADWLKQGAMAAPVDYMGAWDAQLAVEVEKLITDDHAQMDYYRSKGYFADIPRPYADLGEVVAGLKPGRECPEERTMSICMGIAVDDAVTAGLVYERACAAGVGAELPL
ncbi:MAG TPA: peptide transporter [Armatimonadetes bacterium]|jgi:ornithine cyclodeaminase/alanine dehydrogenase|nr:peptide transporter [Armatimonadota bacterium]